MAEMLLLAFGIALGWCLRSEHNPSPTAAERIGEKLSVLAADVATTETWCGPDVLVSHQATLKTSKGDFVVTIERKPA